MDSIDALSRSRYLERRLNKLAQLGCSWLCFSVDALFNTCRTSYVVLSMVVPYLQVLAVDPRPSCHHHLGANRCLGRQWPSLSISLESIGWRRSICRTTPRHHVTILHWCRSSRVSRLSQRHSAAESFSVLVVAAMWPSVAFPRTPYFTWIVQIMSRLCHYSAPGSLFKCGFIPLFGIVSRESTVYIHILFIFYTSWSFVRHPIEGNTTQHGGRRPYQL